MKKPDKRETVNLFFSAFLIIAFVACAYFFNQFALSTKSVLGSVILVCLFAVFGLLLFYATRVGEGKAIKRFSPITLIIMVLPSLYVIAASLIPGVPLHDILASETVGGISVVTTLACIALGYGVPYTFLSGFEIKPEVDEETEETVLEGGLEADLLENAGEEAENNNENDSDDADTYDEASVAADDDSGVDEDNSDESDDAEKSSEE